MKKRAFFLGSGFSKLAGFPVMSYLFDFADQTTRRIDKSSIKTNIEISSWNSCVDSLKRMGLERLSFSDGFFVLHALAICQRQNGNFMPELDYQNAMTFLAKLLICKQEEVKNHITNKQIHPHYESFYSLLGEGDCIISLNYDLISELFLWKLNKWSFLDGYGGFSFSENDLKIMYPGDKPRCSKVTIHKVHGSLNWAVVGKKIYLRDTAFLFDVGGANMPPLISDDVFDLLEAVDFSKTIIYPLYTENFLVKQYVLDIWDRASQDLKQAEEIFCIGTSFDNFDNHLFFMLRNSLDVRVKIYNVNRDSTSTARLGAITNRQVVNIEMDWENWPMRELSE